MKKLRFFVPLLIAAFISTQSRAQIMDVQTTGIINGRIIGVNLQNITGAIVKNKRSNETATSNDLGFYKLEGMVDDTLFFSYPSLSVEIRKIKNLKSRLNVILIKRKVDNLPAPASRSDSSKAKKADDELYKILEKDAKLEGKWNY